MCRRKHIHAGGTLADYKKGMQMEKGDILTVPCDILIPAAIGNVITGDNAADIRCKYLVEAANGPCSPEVRSTSLWLPAGAAGCHVPSRFAKRSPTAASDTQGDAILRGNGVTVLPDIFANAGGVAVSYLEWVQNNQQFRWSEAEINSK